MISRSGRIAAKRLIDTVLIIAFSPLIALAMAGSALAVKLSMGSPVIFTQRRIGLHEQEFSVLKFRTMSNARDDEGILLPDKQRLTKTGRILRKLSLDELPQLINVLRGDMSLIGPRPLLVEYLPFYKEQERLRHAVRPGITGAAQVAGRNGLLWDDRLRIDAEYAESASLIDDTKILFYTVRNVFVAEGVSVVANDSGERLDVVRSYPTDGTYALRRLELADANACLALKRDLKSISSDVDFAVTDVKDIRSWIMRSRSNGWRNLFAIYEVQTGNLYAIAVLDSQLDPEFPELRILTKSNERPARYFKISFELVLNWMTTQSTTKGFWHTKSANLYELITCTDSQAVEKKSSRRVKAEFTQPIDASQESMPLPPKTSEQIYKLEGLSGE